MDFEWDEAKAAENVVKHGLTFEIGKAAFADPFGLDEIDRTSDPLETRWNLISLTNGRELFVTYTIRLGKIRLISVRRAERYERERYWKNR